MKKSEFKKMVSECMKQFGKKMEAGNYTLNEGTLYNPHINQGRGVIPTGSDALNQATATMWRAAKKEGYFYLNGKNFDTNEDLPFISESLKITGVKICVSEIRDTCCDFCRVYMDKQTGKLFCNHYASSNSWDEYDSAIEVWHGNTPASIFRTPAPTMDELREAAERAIYEYNINIG